MRTNGRVVVMVGTVVVVTVVVVVDPPALHLADAVVALVGDEQVARAIERNAPM
jgi:hypothetical protein